MKRAQGLRVARLLMIVSSFAPLFILWGIRGTKFMDETIFSIICIGLVIIPNLFLLARIRSAKKHEGLVPIKVGHAEDHREYLLVYLFAILLPMYVVDLDTCRNFYASVVAMVFIIFLFWHMDLHYMNLLFAFAGYRVYTIEPPEDDNIVSDKSVRVLISRRRNPPSGSINAFRISNFVYFEP